MILSSSQVWAPTPDAEKAYENLGSHGSGPMLIKPVWLRPSIHSFPTHLPWSPGDKGVSLLRIFKEQFWLVDGPNCLCWSNTSPILKKCLSPSNPGTGARLQNSIFWLTPLQKSLWKLLRQQEAEERESVCMCNCISLINKICDPKYLLHSFQIHLLPLLSQSNRLVFKRKTLL